MRAMKFDMSQDGRERATVRLEYRVGYYELCAAAMFFIVNGSDISATTEEKRELVTRANVEKAVRDMLRSYGIGFPSLWEQDEGDLEWVTRRVAELFPNTLPPGN